MLKTPNAASFYDYQQFINNNKEYPRINRLIYLAEHKLSTDKISPKKLLRGLMEENLLVVLVNWPWEKVLLKMVMQPEA